MISLSYRAKLIGLCVRCMQVWSWVVYLTEDQIIRLE